MRDPARIEPVLDAIREAWTANPDLRLVQLLYNAARRSGAILPPIPEFYNVEEPTLLAGLVPPPVCPECRQGKHVNCDGVTWDVQTDAPVPCPCSTRSHQDTP